MGPVSGVHARAVGGAQLKGVGIDVEFVLAKTTVRIRLAREVESQGAGGQLGGGSKGPRHEALGAGEAGWGGARGARAAVQHLRQVAAAVNGRRARIGMGAGSPAEEPLEGALAGGLRALEDAAGVGDVHQVVASNMRRRHRMGRRACEREAEEQKVREGG